MFDQWELVDCFLGWRIAKNCWYIKSTKTINHWTFIENTKWKYRFKKPVCRIGKFYSNDFSLSRLLALEDRFHDLEGHQTRTARSEKQKYEEYIVCLSNESFFFNYWIYSFRLKKIEHFYKKKKSYNQGKILFSFSFCFFFIKQMTSYSNWLYF